MLAGPLVAWEMMMLTGMRNLLGWEGHSGQASA